MKDAQPSSLQYHFFQYILSAKQFDEDEARSCLVSLTYGPSAQAKKHGRQVCRASQVLQD